MTYFNSKYNSARFVPRDGEHDYMDIVAAEKDAGCYATIPYIPGYGRYEVYQIT